MSSMETHYNEHGDLEAEDVEGDATRRGIPLKRGVKTGRRRGKYNRVPADARRRILDCYRAGGDWKGAATANGVAVKTAYGYIQRGDGDGDRVPRKRGGATVMKITEAMVQKLVDYVEASPQISLKEKPTSCFVRLVCSCRQTPSTSTCMAGCSRQRRSSWSQSR